MLQVYKPWDNIGYGQLTLLRREIIPVLIGIKAVLPSTAKAVGFRTVFSMIYKFTGGKKPALSINSNHGRQEDIALAAIGVTSGASFVMGLLAVVLFVV